MADASTDEADAAMDALLTPSGQHPDAAGPAGTCPRDGIAMYDLSLPWMEGSCCELAKLGHQDRRTLMVGTPPFPIIRTRRDRRDQGAPARTCSAHAPKADDDHAGKLEGKPRSGAAADRLDAITVQPRCGGRPASRASAPVEAASTGLATSSSKQGEGATVDSQVEFLDCPAYLNDQGTVRCGLPAEVVDRFSLGLTDGWLARRRDRVSPQSPVQRPRRPAFP